MSSQKKTFASLVRDRRRALGMTYKDLSEESGIDISTIVDIESGKTDATKQEESLLRLALDCKLQSQ
ncbi:MAG: helix-turn-helix domain-containing protein [Lachnospiraceae bacterium]|nr:helix-turn-helix domain-containing protein [Lachnospiraceae bacterium]